MAGSIQVDFLIRKRHQLHTSTNVNSIVFDKYKVFSRGPKTKCKSGNTLYKYNCPLSDKFQHVKKARQLLCIAN